MVGALPVLFIAHIYAEFFGNRVANKRLILPKVVGILDVHFGFLKNEFEKGLFLPHIIVFYMVVLAATQNGKWQIGNFRQPFFGCPDYLENNKQIDHALGFWRG